MYMYVHVVYVLHVHVHVCLLSLYCDRESSSWGERVMQCIWCLKVSLSIVYKNNDDTHMQYMCTCIIIHVLLHVIGGVCVQML